MNHWQTFEEKEVKSFGKLKKRLLELLEEENQIKNNSSLTSDFKTQAYNYIKGERKGLLFAMNLEHLLRSIYSINNGK